MLPTDQRHALSMQRQKIRIPSRPTTAKLTIVDIGRWTLEPRAGLESLLTAGRINIEAVHMLRRLAELIEQLGQMRPAFHLDTKCVWSLLQAIEAGAVVDEEEISANLSWLGQATAILRTIERDDYRVALSRIVKVAEIRVLMHASLIPRRITV